MSAVQKLVSSKKDLAEKMEQAGMQPKAIFREISFALQLVNQDQQLQKCTPVSLQSAVVNIANIGLTLNPAAQEAALIARYNGRTRQLEAQLMPQYRGLAKLACQNSNVVDITCNVVFDKDEFSLDLANTDKPVTHKPYLKKDRGEIYGAYAIATDANGLKKVEWMPIEDIEQARNCSDGFKAFQSKKIKSTPWHDWFPEMARKSVLKRIIKYISGTTENEELSTAVQLDNEDYPADANQMMYIDHLLRTANISDEENNRIYSTSSMSRSEATETIKYLKANQLEGVRYNGGGSMKEIGDSVENAVK